MDLICKGKARIPFLVWEKIPEINRKAIREFEKVCLLEMNDLELTIHPNGMALVRNICSHFDLRMIDQQENKTTFSKAI